MIAWTVCVIVALTGLWMVTITKKNYLSFDHGWFPTHIGSIAKVHLVGLGLVALSVLLMAALIASYRRGGA